MDLAVGRVVSKMGIDLPKRVKALLDECAVFLYHFQVSIEPLLQLRHFRSWEQNLQTHEHDMYQVEPTAGR